MGYYVNPKIATKEAWLDTHGREIPEPAALSEAGAEEAIVCLVDNGTFTAAGVCYSQRELEEFRSEEDPRPRRWFLVSRDALYRVGAITPDVFYPSLAPWIRKTPRH